MSRLGPLSDLDARKFEVRFTTNEQTLSVRPLGSEKCMGILNNRQRKAARRRLSNSILMIADQTAIDPGLNLRRSDAQRQNGYFNEVLLELNMVFRLLPSPSTTAMIASAIPAAISPYLNSGSAGLVGYEFQKAIVQSSLLEVVWECPTRGHRQIAAFCHAAEIPLAPDSAFSARCGSVQLGRMK